MNKANSHQDLEFALRALTRKALSPTAQFGHIALLLAALLMTTVVIALLATEPHLPPRTVVAFSCMAVLALGWAVYSAWSLGRKRPLFAERRWMAMSIGATCLGVFVIGAGVVALTQASAWAWTAAAMGSLLWVGSLIEWQSSRRRVAALRAKERELRSLLERTS